MTEKFQFKTLEEALEFINNPGAPVTGISFKKINDTKWVVRVDWK